jgi:hypothetical protein
MKIDHLCHIRFTWAELKQILADEIQGRANEHIPNTPEYERLMKIVKNARSSGSFVDIFRDEENGRTGGVVICIDGVSYTEEIK